MRVSQLYMQEQELIDLVNPAISALAITLYCQLRNSPPYPTPHPRAQPSPLALACCPHLLAARLRRRLVHINPLPRPQRRRA
jgi:hypothetical protein